MTTNHQAYHEGALALAQSLGLKPSGFRAGTLNDFITDRNPYPADETWTLFEPSDDLDYRALDGREAKLVHEDGGELTFTLHRDPGPLAADTPYDWDAPRHAGVLFTAGWFGYDGWHLYLKGDLPTKRVTADTLEPGTGFAGVSPGGKAYDELIRITGSTGRPLVYSTFFHISFDPSEVEVTEVYGVGTFQKPTKEEA